MENRKELTYAEEIAAKSQLPLGWIEDYTFYPNPRLEDLDRDALNPFKEFNVVHLVNGAAFLVNLNLN
jgi:hypothetical protein